MDGGILINVVIIALVLVAIIRGWDIGCLRQLFSTVGFFLGLFIGASIEPKFISIAHSTITRTLLTLITTLGLGFIFLLIGEFFGLYLKSKLHSKNFNKIDNVLGSVVSAASLLFSIWLCVAILGSLLIPGLQSYIKGSSIVTALDDTLPNAPNVVSDIGALIDPNGFPQVFVGYEPAPDSKTKIPDLGNMQAAVNADENSVVKIEGLGCGGVVEGSGFVVDTDLVATNAHVVAGIKHPFVIDANGNHTATVIWFDPNLDFAILETPNLYGTPLVMDTAVASNNTEAAVLGFPGGNAFTANAAVIINEFRAIGRNIYGQGSTTRNVYELKANVIPGNSGGPVVEADGDVLGVVFAESTAYSQVGYALTANEVVSIINKAQAQDTPVNSGNCAQ